MKNWTSIILSLLLALSSITVNNGFSTSPNNQNTSYEDSSSLEESPLEITSSDPKDFLGDEDNTVSRARLESIRSHRQVAEIGGGLHMTDMHHFEKSESKAPTHQIPTPSNPTVKPTFEPVSNTTFEFVSNTTISRRASSSSKSSKSSSKSSKSKCECSEDETYIYNDMNDPPDDDYDCIIIDTECVPDRTFKEFKKLREVCISKKVTHIGKEAFRKCKNLESVNFEHASSLVEIGASAFRTCESLVTIDLPSTLDTLGKKAFRNCQSLQEVKLSSQMRVIKESTFHNCQVLNTVKGMEYIITLIDENAFTECPDLSDIEVHGRAKYYQFTDDDDTDNSFDDHTDVTIIPGTVPCSTCATHTTINVNEGND